MLRVRGALGDAVAEYRRAIELEPEYQDGMRGLVWTLRLMACYDDAALVQERLVSLEPDSIDSIETLAMIRQDQGRSDEAVAGFRQVIEHDDSRPATHMGLGFALESLGDIEAALESYQTAIRLAPEIAHAWHLLGNCFQGAGRLVEAAAAYEKALERNPDLPKTHYNIGVAHRHLGDLSSALAHYRQALVLDPSYAEAHNGLGVALKDQGRLAESLDHLTRAVELRPHYVDAHSSQLFFRHYGPIDDPSAALAEHRDWAERHAPKPGTVRHTNAPDMGRRLRIGYVSPDLRRHSVAFFIEALLAGHDRSVVEAVGYADVAEPDRVTERLKGLCAGWQDIHGLDDESAATRIREDGIDILVDLAGHTARHRLPLFAHRPAPVQVSYLGYPDTTGLPAIDYRLTDGVADPDGVSDVWHSEKLIRLPHGFLCYRPSEEAPPVAPCPASRDRPVTFGSFNNLAKVGPSVIDAWAAILQELPDARLTIKSEGLSDGEARERISGLFAERNVAPERLDLLAFDDSIADHLARYNKIDVALDSFPYNGTTTTCEALWMGAPVVSFAGEYHVGRVGASLLTQLSLNELIANNSEEYAAFAYRLARNAERRAELRDCLRDRMAASPLTDSKAFARDVESAYREIWRRWCESR